MFCLHVHSLSKLRCWVLWALLPSSPNPSLEILVNRAIFTLPILKFLPWRTSGRNSEADCGWRALFGHYAAKKREGREERTEARKESDPGQRCLLEEPEEVLEVGTGYWMDRNLVGGGEERRMKEDSAAVRWEDLCLQMPSWSWSHVQQKPKDVQTRWLLDTCSAEQSWECASSDSGSDTASELKNTTSIAAVLTSSKIRGSAGVVGKREDGGRGEVAKPRKEKDCIPSWLEKPAGTLPHLQEILTSVEISGL